MSAQVGVVMAISRDIFCESSYLVHNLVLSQVLLLQYQVVMEIASLKDLQWDIILV